MTPFALLILFTVSAPPFGIAVAVIDMPTMAICQQTGSDLIRDSAATWAKCIDRRPDRAVR